MRFRLRIGIRLAALCGLGVTAAGAGGDAPYLDLNRSGARDVYEDPAATLEARLDDLLTRLALEEQCALLDMDCPAIERLGLPAHHWWSEAIHGVARRGRATQFPVSIALAATWDPALLERIAAAIGDEARALHHADEPPTRARRYHGLTIWSPTVNMARDPRWGRTEETYGEDPWLASRLAVAFVRGLQGDDPRYLKCVATVKHFAANNTEHNRFSVRPAIAEADLRDYYFRPFQAAIQEAGVESIMCAYNGLNGVPCGANRWLLTDVLRGDWGFRGTVVTDVGVPLHLIDKHEYVKTRPESTQAMLAAGVNVFCSSERFGGDALEAVRNGLVEPAAVAAAVRQNLRTRMRLGQFDPAELNPYAAIPAGVVGCAAHIELARQAARESAVLLKNEPPPGGARPLLPIERGAVRRIVVAGPFAHRNQLGGYSGQPTRKAETPLAALQARADATLAVEYLPPAETFVPIPAAALVPAADGGERGLRGEYFAGRELAGTPHVVRTDSEVDFDWHGPMTNIDSALPTEEFSVRWTGALRPIEAGRYRLGVARDGMDVALWLDDRQVLVGTERSGPAEAGGVELEAGRVYALRLEAVSQRPGGRHVMLQWYREDRPLPQPAAAEREATVVVYVGGISMEHSDEDKDRRSFDLPVTQQRELREIVGAYPRTVVVLNGGQPITLGALGASIPAVLQNFYAGQEGGVALAELLLGDVSPSGRLPLTYFAAPEDLPDFEDYALAQGRTYMYFAGRPAYAFGHGLSYARFEYRGVALSQPACDADGGVRIAVDLSNAGPVDANEVVQVYARRIAAPAGDGARDSLQRLCAFGRVRIAAGQAARLELDVAAARLARWDPAQRRAVVVPGRYELRVGGSSADIRATAELTVR